MRIRAALLAALVTTSAAATAQARVPAPLSAETAPVNLHSTYGSGRFGRWEVDQWGLPAYDYTDDELSDPDARQPELDGATAAQHQLGNDNIKGMAFNEGYTEFWSQDLMAQWAAACTATARPGQTKQSCGSPRPSPPASPSASTTPWAAWTAPPSAP